MQQPVFKITKLFLLFLVIVMVCYSPALTDDIVEQKQELEKIKQELEQCQESLDSLKSVEKSVLKEIADYEQQANANKTVLKRLNNQLYAIKKNVDKAKGNLDESQSLFKATHGRYANNLTYYYKGTRNDQPEYYDEIEHERKVFRKMVYLRALASYDRDDLTKSSEYLSQAENEFTGLVDREKKIDNAQKNKNAEYVILSSSKESRERDLSRLRRTKERETDRLLTLSEAARQMEDLVARLERSRLEREGSGIKTDFDYFTGNFAAYKGGLPAPLNGTIIKGFGWKTDKTTKLKSFSPGIEISGKKKAPVMAIAPGVTAYVGNLRGYGNFVIVEHEDGFYSTYAGLDNLVIEQGQIVDAGDKLGNAPTGVIKFELRQGREAIDPMEWMRIDALK
jgi:septal ring factor EnvC (AmiA/AmiB activator)